jgi:hypothetical protein
MGLSENGGIPIKWQFKRETDDELIHGFRGTLFSEQKHEKNKLLSEHIFVLRVSSCFLQGKPLSVHTMPYPITHLLFIHLISQFPIGFCWCNPMEP